MAESLGTPDFLRVRCGVGRPRRGDPRSVADYVLGAFYEDEDPADLIERAADCVEAILADGIDEAERRFASRGAARHVGHRAVRTRVGARRALERRQPARHRQLAAMTAGAGCDQHDEAAEHRSGHERPRAVRGFCLSAIDYDRSVTRYPAPFVNMAREVRDALVRGGPVVALETTYVSHGFPHPTGSRRRSRRRSRSARPAPSRPRSRSWTARSASACGPRSWSASRSSIRARCRRATSRPRSPTARSAPPRSPAPSRSRGSAASTTPRPAASAACTATPSARSTSPPT